MKKIREFTGPEVIAFIAARQWPPFPEHFEEHSIEVEFWYLDSGQVCYRLGLREWDALTWFLTDVGWIFRGDPDLEW